MAQNIPPLPGKPNAKNAPRLRSFWRDDFPQIRKSAIMFGVCLAVSLGMIFGSTYVLSIQKKNKMQSEAQHTEAKEKFSQAENEKAEVRDFQAKYVQLVKRGFVGDEKRLEWIEGIRIIQEERRLPPLTYEIFARQPIELDSSVSIGELQLRATKMIVNMNLLHTGDLFNFLSDMKSKGLYTSQQCAIKLLDSNRLEPLAPRLNAECTLNWITLGKASDPNATDNTATSAPAPPTRAKLMGQ